MFAVPISESDIDELREVLKEIKKPVPIYTFVADKCRYCDNTVKLVDLIARAGPKYNGLSLIHHRVIRFNEKSREIFRKFGISRVPTVMLLDGYIKYVGMPAGEEVRGFIETIIRLGSDDSGLSSVSKRLLASINKHLTIEVIVTPTCPYCPYASVLSNMFAFESYRNGSKLITSLTIEAYENPDIADKYNVMTVPAIAVNNSVEFVGPPTEDQLLRIILRYGRASG